jgi:hypothetical protein
MRPMVSTSKLGVVPESTRPTRMVRLPHHARARMLETGRRERSW